MADAQYFEEFYRAISTGDGDAITLFRRDGTLLTRHPHREGMIGMTMPVQSPWYETIAKGAAPTARPVSSGTCR